MHALVSFTITILTTVGRLVYQAALRLAMLTLCLLIITIWLVNCSTVTLATSAITATTNVFCILAPFVLCVLMCVSCVLVYGTMIAYGGIILPLASAVAKFSHRGQDESWIHDDSVPEVQLIDLWVMYEEVAEFENMPVNDFWRAFLELIIDIFRL